MTIKRKLFIEDSSKIVDNPIQRNMQYEQVISVTFLENIQQERKFLNNHNYYRIYHFLGKARYIKRKTTSDRRAGSSICHTSGSDTIRRLPRR